MSDLQDALNRHFLLRRFEWAKNDCTYAVANVLEDLGDDRMKKVLEAAYRTKSEALRWMKEGGGIQQISSWIFPQNGFRRVAIPKERCVGVLIDQESGPVLSIYDGKLFWAKTDLGACFSRRAEDIYSPE